MDMLTEYWIVMAVIACAGFFLQFQALKIAKELASPAPIGLHRLVARTGLTIVAAGGAGWFVFATTEHYTLYLGQYYAAPEIWAAVPLVLPVVQFIVSAFSHNWPYPAEQVR